MGGTISVRRSVSRYDSNTGRSGDNGEAGRGDAGSDVMTLALSDAKSDEQSTARSFQTSDGRSDEVSFRVSVLWCFPVNSEANFPASFHRSFELRVSGSEDVELVDADLCHTTIGCT
jgi:hypothetical protein